MAELEVTGTDTAELAVPGRTIAEVAVPGPEMVGAPFAGARLDEPPKVKVADGRAVLAGAMLDGPA